MKGWKIWLRSWDRFSDTRNTPLLNLIPLMSHIVIFFPSEIPFKWPIIRFSSFPRQGLAGDKSCRYYIKCNIWKAYIYRNEKLYKISQKKLSYIEKVLWLLKKKKEKKHTSQRQWSNILAAPMRQHRLTDKSGGN